MLNSDNEYRISAEALLASASGHHSNRSSVQGYPQNDLSNSQSINTIPSLRPEIVISEDLIAGQRINGTMSNVRRFFCLFVTFDLLLTSLMWVICIVLNGDNLMNALKVQVLNYNVRSSLFDVVMVAICRFTVLLLFYALLYINHWIIISLSTAGTCIFLICKVFVFDWTVSHQPVFQVFLILASFILAWSEAWFLDFRVIPQETNASRYLVTSDTERTPLIRSYVQGLPSTYTESVGNFYSPMQSPEGSMQDWENEREQMIRFTQHETESYKKQATKLLEEAWRTLNHTDWKMEKQSAEGDTVETLTLPKVFKTKLFRLTGVVDIQPRCLLDELFFNVSEMTKWNSAVLECQKLASIDENTDITYQATFDNGGGFIKSRDFVNLRHWAVIDDCYVIAFKSTEHHMIPERKDRVRGENGVGCLVMRPINNEPNKCVFQWLLNTNLKGLIPKYVLNTALTDVLFDYLRDLRARATKLKQNSKTR